MKLSNLELYIARLKTIFNRNNETNGVNDKIFNFDIIGYLYRFNAINDKDAENRINNKTIDDIDFYEVFKFIDHAKSKVGQQYLFNKLLNIECNFDFKEQELWINYLIENKENRSKIEEVLSKLNEPEAYLISNLFLDDYVKPPSYFSLLRIFTFLPIVFGILTAVSNYFFILLGLSIVINLILHYKNKMYLYLYKDSIPQLLRLLKCAKDISILDPLAKSSSVLSASIRSIDCIKNKMFVFQLEKAGNSDLFEIFFILFEYIKIIFLLEPFIVFDVLDKLSNKKEDIKTLFNYVGKIDTYISILHTRTVSTYYCIPDFSSDCKTLEFKNVYHPLIDKCVPNSLKIEGRSILLTGSNMAGKTTFIRSVAINTLLAQTINTCFANKFILSPLRLFTAIRISDDLLSDKSYYFEEVSTIKRLVDKSVDKKASLFMLDEIFKGTNTIERISAGKAVLSYLSKSAENIVFVSTHDVELTELLKDSYDLYHFSEVIENNQINFDYKLKKGYLSTRNAIRILELNNYPDVIIEDARQTSQLIERNII